jgi:hypothetical protein
MKTRPVLIRPGIVQPPHAAAASAPGFPRVAADRATAYGLLAPRRPLTDHERHRSPV